MRRYSVGFLFNQNAACVALISKKRPEWQCGLWNGIGGHIEEGEAPIDAMVREFYEETGQHVEEWNLFAEIDGTPNYIISFFRSFNDEALVKVKTTTDEVVMVNQVARLPFNIVPNLAWLIPLALDKYIKAPTYFDGKRPVE
jgi:8-oxo-dGTP diphosphatase